MKLILSLLAFLSALLIVVQLVMGMLIRTGEASPGLRTAHFHSGTLMALVALIYIGLSLTVLVSRRGGPRAG
jgi:heme A synthase